MSSLTSQVLNVKIIHDIEKLQNVGYLEDYILDGYSFGFKEKLEAEEFSAKASFALKEYLTKMMIDYKESLI
jgi:hypothetical protein